MPRSSRARTRSRASLLRLLDIPGPSGYEAAAAEAWREEAAPYGRVEADRAGNSFLTVGPEDGPTVLIGAHIDEIGLTVVHIDADGYLFFDEIGGWDLSTFVGQRVRLMATGPKATGGEVLGVIGRINTHMLSDDAHAASPKLYDMWVDIGARSEKEARSLVNIGDAGVLAVTPQILRDRFLVSRSVDNRLSTYIGLEVAKRYAAKPGQARLVVCASTKEEIGLDGSGLASDRKPDIALVLDVTSATDVPDAADYEYGKVQLGEGPVLARGAVCSPVIVNLLAATAKAKRIPFSYQACGKSTGTDAEAFARSGAATAVISIPNRYMHTPNEMVDLEDVDHIIDLIVAFLGRVTPGMDLIPRSHRVTR